MDYKDLIRFVPAGPDQVEEVKESKQDRSHCLTGEEAKAFYEELISENAHSSNIELLNFGAVHKNQQRSRRERSSKTYEETEDYSNKQAGATESCASDKDFSDDIIDIKQEPFDFETFASSDGDLCDVSTRFKQNQDGRDFIRVHNKLLSYAQNGDLKELKGLYKYEKKLDTNYQDGFGWTALMCAAMSGHQDVIKFLLSKGANKYILNSKGKTVSELCEEAGKIDIKILINTYHKISKVKIHKKDSESFFCDICKREFLECSQKEHESSTVHLFNMKLKPKPDQYVIPETNRGYQLMKRSGWNGETGLGPSGQGSKYPVKTSLKRDRQCLGSVVKGKAKVTHYGPGDQDAIKSIHKHSQRVMSAKAVSKREMKRREQKIKQWERNLRTYMNSDF